MKKALDFSTEEKIKRAARDVFHQKGFAATRTRDIAEAAGINLALLNYYFRSKEKLFQLIVLETLQAFAGSLGSVLNNADSSLSDKVEAIVSRYIDMLLVEPHIPIFIMSELRNNPDAFMSKLPIKELMMKSAFAKQYTDAVKSGMLPPIPMLHFLMNILGLTVFPFIAAPMIKRIGDLKDEEFNALMTERKKMIPVWLKAIMNSNTERK